MHCTLLFFLIFFFLSSRNSTRCVKIAISFVFLPGLLEIQIASLLHWSPMITVVAVKKTPKIPTPTGNRRSGRISKNNTKIYTQSDGEGWSFAGFELFQSADPCTKSRSCPNDKQTIFSVVGKNFLAHIDIPVCFFLGNLLFARSSRSFAFVSPKALLLFWKSDFSYQVGWLVCLALPLPDGSSFSQQVSALADLCVCVCPMRSVAAVLKEEENFPFSPARSISVRLASSRCWGPSSCNSLLDFSQPSILFHLALCPAFPLPVAPAASSLY